MKLYKPETFFTESERKEIFDVSHLEAEHNSDDIDFLNTFSNFREDELKKMFIWSQMMIKPYPDIFLDLKLPDGRFLYIANNETVVPDKSTNILQHYYSLDENYISYKNNQIMFIVSEFSDTEIIMYDMFALGYKLTFKENINKKDFDFVYLRFEPRFPNNIITGHLKPNKKKDNN